MCGIRHHPPENICSRWNEIHLVATPAPLAQTHQSLNSPNPMEGTPPPIHSRQQHDEHRVSKTVMMTDSTPTPTHVFINLDLTQHTLVEMNNVLTVTLGSDQCTKVYMYHPAMPITSKHTHTFNCNVRLEQHQHLSNRIVLYHLCITVVSLNIPRDRSLDITIENTIYTLTTRGTDDVATSHSLRCFLNLHISMPFLRHTHEVDERITYRL